MWRGHSWHVHVGAGSVVGEGRACVLRLIKHLSRRVELVAINSGGSRPVFCRFRYNVVASGNGKKCEPSPGRRNQIIVIIVVSLISEPPARTAMLHCYASPRLYQYAALVLPLLLRCSGLVPTVTMTAAPSQGSANRLGFLKNAAISLIGIGVVGGQSLEKTVAAEPLVETCETLVVW